MAYYSWFGTISGTTAATLLAVMPSAAAQEVKFSLPRDTVLLDEKISIAVRGLPAIRAVTLRLVSAGDQGRWTSSATFLTDSAGGIDLTRAAAIAGSYAGVNAMGLFWSARLDPSVGQWTSAHVETLYPAPEPWELRIQLGGLTVAADTVWRRGVRSSVRVMRVRERGLVGTFYHTPGRAPTPGLIVLAGGNGGVLSSVEQPGGLASQGFSVLSLAYFAGEGLPPQLSGIKLEYFKAAIDWIRTQPSVDRDHIGLVGISRGGELALLLAARYPQIKAVAAYVPSHVVWSGCCDSLAQTGAAWTYRGVPIPHMPAAPAIRRAMSALSPEIPVRRTPIFISRLEDTIAAANAAIPVERINGPVLLISGEDDQVWPSSFMAEQIMARFRQHGFKHPNRHLAYSGAGHGIGRPYTSTMDIHEERHPITRRLSDLGGTPAGTARASEESWTKLLQFLQVHLGASAAGVRPSQN
jgi:dienelactone hydrolase